MIAAVDVYYCDTRAKVVAVLFESFQSETPTAIIEKMMSPQRAYEAGAFDKRELPCVLAVLDTIKQEDIEVILIDGYVYIDEAKTDGFRQLSLSSSR
ncbi:hypothetical protein [Myroides sp. NP-2]|uniref:hypothetical protein n=1 Tax=Myroides sp. NP-2 TaxID=2759945 RepID=UPI001C72768D|nr:hypothetical protein [Myroides sp. NP-2]